jgi:hypothetical protein
MRNCGDCRFFELTGHHAGLGYSFGECHRFPPIPPPRGNGNVWPVVKKHDWCGEWADLEPAHAAVPVVVTERKRKKGKPLVGATNSMDRREPRTAHPPE